MVAAAAPVWRPKRTRTDPGDGHRSRFSSFILRAVVVFFPFPPTRCGWWVVVYLAQALGNMLLAVVLVAGKTVQRLFLGSLRFREVERLHLRIREAVIETCLAMTVFRDDFNTHFILMFGLLLFLKVFHWLAKDRIEFVRFLFLRRCPFCLPLLVAWGGGCLHSIVLFAVLSVGHWHSFCHAGANRRRWY